MIFNFGPIFGISIFQTTVEISRWWQENRIKLEISQFLCKECVILIECIIERNLKHFGIPFMEYPVVVNKISQFNEIIKRARLYPD